MSRCPTRDINALRAAAPRRSKRLSDLLKSDIGTTPKPGPHASRSAPFCYADFKCSVPIPCRPPRMDPAARFTSASVWKRSAMNAAVSATGLRPSS